MSNHEQQRLKWIPVLMYHRVVESVRPPNPSNVQISVADFDAQMAYLSGRGFQAIRLEDVPTAVSEQSPWQKPVAISFDDGYEDNYIHALPILKKHGLFATIMLTSGYIGGRNHWDDGKAETAALLSLRQIQVMAREGMNFGAHGTIHLPLADISTAAARRELAESKAALEDALGQEVATFAYPYGRTTPEVCRFARDTGYAVAFGVDQVTHSLFNFSRIDAAAFRGDTFRWRLKVAGMYRCVEEHTGAKVPNNVRDSVRKHIGRAWRRIMAGMGKHAAPRELVAAVPATRPNEANVSVPTSTLLSLLVTVGMG